MRSLATRIAAVTVILVSLAVVVAVGGAWLLGQRVADEAVSDSLEASQAVQRYLQRATAREVALTTDLIAADPHFTAYLAEAIRGGLDDEEGIDYRSILDQVDDRRREWGFDFAMMLDQDGRLLVRTDRPDVDRVSRADHPLVRSAMEDLIPDYGPWREGNRLYNAAVVPVSTAFEVVGYLISGLEIDNDVAADIQRVTGVDVVFLTLRDGQPILTASTLNLQHGEQLVDRLAAGTLGRLLAGETVERLDLDFDGENWVARAQPVTDADGEVLGAVVTIDSLDARLAGHRTVQASLIGTGVLAILIALALSILLARRIARPVSTLAAVADQAAQGDYEQSFDTRGRDEVGTLARAISRLLADLREQQEIAGYVSDLSRHLDDSGSGESPEPARARAPEPEPPPSGPAFILALAWRSAPERSGAEALEALEGWLPTLAEMSQRHRARLVPAGGTRLLLVFGKDQVPGLMTCLAGVLNHAAASDTPPAMALAAGDIDTTRLGVDSGYATVVSGRPVEHCERLLPEAGPGRLLLSPGARNQLETAFENASASTTSCQGQVSKRRFHQLTGVRPPDVTLETRPSGSPAKSPPDSSAARTEPIARPPAPAAAIQPGQTLGDRYTILERIGEGAMGTVFRARDQKLDEAVALKVLKPGMAGDAEQLERMKSEIRLARRITHPNVLRTHDFWEIDGQPVISMEYVRGITLSQLLESSGRLSLAAGLRVCTQVLQGLEAAHAAGVLHRDIKPANIILDQAGNARLMDFGIARQAMQQGQDLTQPGTLVGTANYMAPEVILGKAADARSDLYSVGVMMNEIFTGRLPLDGETAMQVCMAHVQKSPAPPSQSWPQIPPPLETIIMTCLAKKPDQRYADAATLLRELNGVRRHSAAATGSNHPR